MQWGGQECGLHSTSLYLSLKGISQHIPVPEEHPAPLPSTSLSLPAVTGEKPGLPSAVIQLLSHVSSPFYSREDAMCAKPTVLTEFPKQHCNQCPFRRAFLSLFVKPRCSEHLPIQSLPGHLGKVLDRLSL